MFVTSLKKIRELEGILTPIEFKELSFEPKRIFLVTDVPPNTTRGKHAHKKTQQLLICLQGKIIVTLYDGYNEIDHCLKKGDSIFVPEMIWDEQLYTTKDSMLLSICSTPYDESDYIKYRETFSQMVRTQ